MNYSVGLKEQLDILGKYANLFSCRKFDEAINTTLISVR